MSLPNCLSRSSGSGNSSESRSNRRLRRSSIRASTRTRNMSRLARSKVPQPMRTRERTRPGCATAYASASIAPQECPTSAGASLSQYDLITSSRSSTWVATVSALPPLERWKGSRIRNARKRSRVTAFTAIRGRGATLDEGPRLGSPTEEVSRGNHALPRASAEFERNPGARGPFGPLGLRALRLFRRFLWARSDIGRASRRSPLRGERFSEAERDFGTTWRDFFEPGRRLLGRKPDPHLVLAHSGPDYYNA